MLELLPLIIIVCPCLPPSFFFRASSECSFESSTNFTWITRDSIRFLSFLLIMSSNVRLVSAAWLLSSKCGFLFNDMLMLKRFKLNGSSLCVTSSITSITRCFKHLVTSFLCRQCPKNCFKSSLSFDTTLSATGGAVMVVGVANIDERNPRSRKALKA